MKFKNPSLFAALFLFTTLGLMTNFARSQTILVRNDALRPGHEILMLRHAFLQKGGYQQWFQASRAGVWPWYEKIGTRIVGDWQIFYPNADSEYPDNDEALRLARYASFEHWQSTRAPTSDTSGDTGGFLLLGGNGPDYDSMRNAMVSRTSVQTGSKGGIFLQGYMAPDRPIHLPAMLESRNVPANESSTPVLVRNDIARPAEQILVLDYWKIRKGNFELFHALTRDLIWPYLEKIGVRPVGQWKVIHTSASTTEENPDYDEVYMLTRYSGYQHWQAVQNPASLGGNGRDYEMMISGQDQLQSLVQESSNQFLKGDMYNSPPLYMPGYVN